MHRPSPIIAPITRSSYRGLISYTISWSIGVQLLGDLVQIFRANKENHENGRLPSETLVGALVAMEERPWGAWGRMQKPIDQRQLAGLLKPYKITSGTIRPAGGGTPKGYHFTKINSMFARYGAFYPPQRHNPMDTGVSEQNPSATMGVGVADEKPPRTAFRNACGVVADKKAQIWVEKKGFQETEPEPDPPTTPSGGKKRTRKTKVADPKMQPAAVLKDFGVTVSYVTTTEHAQQAVEVLLQVPKTLGLDIETARLPEHAEDPRAGLDPYLSRIRLLQLYPGGDTCFVFDLTRVDLKALQPLWAKPFVAHNAVFELKHLLHAGVVLSGSPHCTLLMGAALYNERLSLADAAARGLNIEIDKSLQTSDWSLKELSEDQLAYAALDAVLTKRLAEKLSSELRARKLTRGYTLLRNVQPSVATMELSGVALDVEKHRDLALDWTQKRDEAYALLQAEIGSGLNVRSVKQLSAWLRTRLDEQQLAAWPVTATGVLCTDAYTLKHAASDPRIISALEPLLSFKTYEKLVSTYGGAFAGAINPVTGRIHAGFLIASARSGRFTCHSPNIQNQPRGYGFRELFTAPEGRALVVADFNQIELRVAALVSEDPAMLGAFDREEDLHRKTAAKIKGCSEDVVTKDDRQMAKAVNFGLLYGMGAAGLSLYAQDSYGVTMTVPEAAAAIDAFFAAYPGLRRWQVRTARISKAHLLSHTPGGRQRKYTANNYKYTQALNTPIQGGAADVLLATLAILEERLKGIDAKLVLHVHDEIVLEASEPCTEEAQKVLTEAMVAGFTKIFPNRSTRRLVDAKIGRSWGEAK